MNEDKGKLESIFHAALELQTEEERAEYVRQACEGDDELRDRVTRMLRALKQSDSVFSMDGSGASEKLHADSSALISEGPGSLIGEYKLLQKIGEGGFGVVYMAEQRSPIVRKVALKIIKLGMDTRQVIARFEAERQALALLDHPNVAKVLGAGSTDSGRPYFCMELVNGLPITDFCDRNQATTRDRLTLFGEVCEAIQHAHRKGLIHRDIKPSNILVTLHDGKPVPKVIDFGIAKAIGQRLTEKTLFTHFQQLIGTPAYMSPEQAEMSGLDIDTRTDVYSLGVLLYELLTGTTPFSEKRLLSLACGEMQRVITEEEPTKPSTRLSTMENEEVTAVAKHRKLEVSEVSRSVQGDLDLIVMKALDKDRSRRYDTPREIIADIERHFLNQPIMAAPPGFAYLFIKFYRRHRVALTTAAAFLTMLTLATVISIRFAFLADAQKNHAEEQGERASEAEQTAIEQLSHAQAQLGIMDLENNRPNGLLHLVKACVTSLGIPATLDFHRAQWMFWNQYLAGRLYNVLPADGMRGFPPVSSDGRWMSTRGLDEDLEPFRLWEINTGNQYGPDFPHAREVEDSTKWRVGRFVTTPDKGRIALMYYPRRGNIRTKTICVHDSNTGRLIARREFETEFWLSLTFDPDGQAVIIQTSSGLIRWRYARQLVETIPLPIIPEKLTTVWATRDGQRFIAASKETVIGIDLSSATPVWEFQYNSPMTAFGLSHDEELLAIGAGNGDVFTLNTISGRDYQLLAGNVGMPVKRLEISSDRSLIAASGNTRPSESGDQVHLWHLADGAHSQILANRYGWMINHHGRFVLQFSTDNDRIHIRDAITGKSLPDVSDYRTMNGWIQAPADDLLLGHSSEITHVWRTEPHPRAKLLSQSRKPGTHLTKMSPKGFHFALATDQSNLVEIWSVADSAPTGPPLSMPSDVRAMAFNPGSDELAVLDRQGNLALWIYPSAEKRVLTTFPVESPLLGQMVFHFDPLFIGMVAFHDHSDESWSEIIFVNPIDNQPVYNPIRIDSQVFSMSLHPDGKTLVVGMSKGGATLWNIETGRQLGDPLHQTKQPTAASDFNSEGTLLATGSLSDTAMLWDVSSGQKFGSTILLRGGIESVSFDPSGRWLATFDTTRQNRIQLWDVLSQRRLGPALSQNVQSSVSALEFASGGTELIWAYQNGEVYSWSIPELPSSNDDLRKQSWTTLGMRFGDKNNLQPLSANEWQELRQENLPTITEYDGPVFDLASVSDGALFAETAHGLLKYNKERESWERSIFRNPIGGGIESTQGMLFTTTRHGELYFSFNQSDGQRWSSVKINSERIASSRVMAEGSQVYVNWQNFPQGKSRAGSQYSRLGSMDIHDRIWKPLPPSPRQVSSFATLNNVIYTATLDHTRGVQRQVPSLFIPAWSIAAIPNLGRPSDAMKTDWIESYTGGAEKDLKEFQSGGFPHGWRVYTGADSAGRIDLTKATGDVELGTAYLFASIESKKEQSATIALIADDMATVWLNGKEVHREQLVADYSQTETRLIHVNLVAGQNRLLIKIVNDVRTWRSLEDMRAWRSLDWSIDLSVWLSNPEQIRISPDGVNFQPVVMKPGWEVINRGIENLNVTSLETFDESLFAGTATAGVFRFDHEADEWIPFNSQMSGRSITHLEASEQFLYAGTIDEGVFRFDGTTWTKISETLGKATISTLSVHEEVVHVGTWNGKVFESQDHGDTWIQLPGIPQAL